MIRKGGICLLALLLFAGCSKESEPEFPRQEAKAERYISYQADGEWQKLCRMLSPAERKRVRQALRGECAKKIPSSPDLARNLQEKARGAKVTGIKREGDIFEIQIGSDLIWITPEGISLRAPS